ncbi:dehydrogenase [Natrialbaceae archaeon GCM10025810]|uniref:dehydrogenase n=1 Tax=Halovalidus salilacus TaxID=3075124 RepID=UPI00360F037A
MVVEIAYELPYEDWGWKVGLYVALIGISGGAYLWGYAADVRSRNADSQAHGQVARYGYLTGLLGMAIGPPIMLTHLATPLRAMILPTTMTNFASWMTIGAYFIGGFVPGVLLMFVWAAFGSQRPHSPSAVDGSAKATTDGGRDVASDGDAAKAATGGGTADGVRGIVGRIGFLGLLDDLADRTRPSETARLVIGGVVALFAAGVVLYSAMALGSGSMERVPLWDKTYLVPVQLLSGLGAGLFVAVGLSALESRRVGTPLRNYSLIAAGLLAASLIAIVATVTLLPGESETAAASVDNMLTTYAGLFLGVALVGGIALPIALSIGAAFGQRADSLPENAVVASYAAAAALVVVGKIALALTYLMAAEFTTLPLPV